MNQLLGVLFLSLVSFAAQGQSLERMADKLDRTRAENWPPVRSHTRNTLGAALQQTFKRHAEFCGFGVKDETRDFVPPDASRFLGRRNLQTRVETADIAGGGLMLYVFSDNERFTAFPSIRFTPSRVLNLPGIAQPFSIRPDDNFDSFILTKTCGGYLKSSLDAGIEPPYASFRAALETDSRRESSVIAISGSFVSPLSLALDGRDRRTAEIMMKLWQFYKSNPDYIGRAYYLKEFQGVMIKHVSTADENAKLESQGALNLSGVLPVKLKASLGAGTSRQQAFSGTDWQTILFTDFDAAYRREQLFAPLPTPAEISAYFERLSPMAYLSDQSPAIVEGGYFHHQVELPGVPEDMVNLFWELEAVGPGCFEGTPELAVQYFAKGDNFGCRFSLNGKPSRAFFTGPPAQRPGTATLEYVIRSKQAIGGEHIRIKVKAEAPTSAHPLARMGRGEFNVSKKENKQFALQWIFEVEVEDTDNPVDFSVVPRVEQLVLRNADRLFPVRVTEVQPDAYRKRFFVIMESVETWPLESINDNELTPFNLSMDLHLKSKKAEVYAIRPVQGRVYLPAIRPAEIKPELPALLENDGLNRQ